MQIIFKNLSSLLYLFFLFSLKAFCTQEEGNSVSYDAIQDLFDLPSVSRQQKLVKDPFEKINRSIFGFNTKVVGAIINKRRLCLFGCTRKPRHRGEKGFYIFKVGISNFLSNLLEASNTINFALQKKPHNAFKSMWRFLINSSIGFGGILDIARLLELEKQRSSFEQTLVFYGAGPGPYFVIPILGSYSLRRIVGDFFEVLTNPLFFLIDSKFAVFVIYDYQVVSAHFDYYDLVFQGNIDTYAKLRSLYLQSNFY